MWKKLFLSKKIEENLKTNSSKHQIIINIYINQYV